MTINRLLTLGLVYLWIMTGAVACGEAGDTEDGVDLATGIALALQWVEDSDVTHLQYQVYQGDCAHGSSPPADDHGPPLLQKTVALEELTLPGGLVEFEDRPFDAYAGHPFVDLLLLVPAGCYEVHVQPLADEESPSQQCLALATTVAVVAGQTTEAVLVSQCARPGAGAGVMDTVAAFNRPPLIAAHDLDPPPILGCPAADETVEICAEAIDADGDPLDLRWWRADAQGQIIFDDQDQPIPFADTPGIASMTVIDGESAPGYLRECVAVAFAEPIVNAQYLGVAAAFDKLYDQGGLITVERWFADRKMTVDGDPILSRDTRPFAIVIDGCDDQGQ